MNSRQRDIDESLTGGKSSFFSPRSGLAARLAKTPSFDGATDRLLPDVVKLGSIVGRRVIADAAERSWLSVLDSDEDEVAV
jgi:hypothetical protein